MSGNDEAAGTGGARPDGAVHSSAELFDLVAGAAARDPAGKVQPMPWSGLLFRVDGQAFLAPLAQVEGVLALAPDLTPVPGTGDLVLGIGNHQGTLLPIVDLGVLVRGGPALRRETDRVLVVCGEGVPCGVAVSAVLGVRQCDAGGRTAAPPGLPAPLGPFLDGAFDLVHERVPVLALERLLAAPLMGLG